MVVFADNTKPKFFFKCFCLMSSSVVRFFCLLIIVLVQWMKNLIPVGMTSYLKFGYGSDVAIICISRNAQSQVLMKAAVVSLFINL